MKWHRVMLLSALIAAGAQAQPEVDGGADDRIALDYAAAPESRCMGEEELRSELAARLGADRIDPQAAREVRVRIARQGRELVAVVTILQGGESVGERTLRAFGRRCDELGEDLLLTLSLIADTPPVRPEPPEEPVEEPPPAPQPQLQPAQPEPRGVEAPPAAPEVAEVEASASPFRVQLAALAAFGELPRVGWGLEAAVSLTYPRLSFSFGVRYTGARARAFAPGEISTFMVRARIGALARFAGFEAGALAVVGASVASGSGYEFNARVARPTFRLGVQVAYLWQLTPTVALRPFLEVLGGVVVTDLQVDQERVWRGSRVSGAAGLAIVWGR